MKLFMLLVFFLFSVSIKASTLIDELSKCNAEFFSAIRESKAIQETLKKPINAEQSTIITPEMAKSRVTFSPPVNDNGLTLTQYFHTKVYIGDVGSVYLWGVAVAEPYAEVISTLSGIRWKTVAVGQLASGNHQIKKYTDAQWSENDKAVLGSLATSTFSVEKALVAEKGNDGTTWLYCELKGHYIDDEVLRNIRPDLFLTH